jgi:hypothetical protein
MMIRYLNHPLARELIPMDMAVRLVVVDTQQAFAVRKGTFPALRRSLQRFCHCYSFIGEPRKAAKG